MQEPINLRRFLDAQDGRESIDKSCTAYEVALKEILDGKKTSHWIWYIFPQGPFGTSERAQRYAITSRAEAIAFLQNPVLRGRLLEITAAVASHLTAGIKPASLMGSDIDCKKLASSMTLFKLIAGELDDQEFSSATKSVLEQLTSHGWGECTKTLDWMQNF